MLEDSDDEINILKNDNEEDPVTLADLKVNEIIIKGINEKYKNINWRLLVRRMLSQQIKALKLF